jgi:hypothetical protein
MITGHSIWLEREKTKEDWFIAVRRVIGDPPAELLEAYIWELAEEAFRHQPSKSRSPK